MPAIVAAPTTSLPETPGGERNWDYRFSWIRDSTFMLWALYSLGFDEEANDFFYFIEDMAEAEAGQLQIMYGIGGESRLDEQVLEHLSTCHQVELLIIKRQRTQAVDPDYMEAQAARFSDGVLGDIDAGEGCAEGGEP